MSTEFSKFKEYYIRECTECGICFKNCFAYKNTKIPIHKHLKNLFQWLAKHNPTEKEQNDENQHMAVFSRHPGNLPGSRPSGAV